jgi:hypothetical protein
MRIVEYHGTSVKRQKRIGPNQIKVVFYDRHPIIVAEEQWARNSANRFIDHPNVRRREVVRQRRSWWWWW